jgi:hypothetical protein
MRDPTKHPAVNKLNRRPSSSPSRNPHRGQWIRRHAPPARRNDAQQRAAASAASQQTHTMMIHTLADLVHLSVSEAHPMMDQSGRCLTFTRRPHALRIVTTSFCSAFTSMLLPG